MKNNEPNGKDETVEYSKFRPKKEEIFQKEHPKTSFINQLTELTDQHEKTDNTHTLPHNLSSFDWI